MGAPKKIVPVILCGGSGTRLWPSSREKLPKQFLNLLSDKSLLQETVLRALRISGAKAENVVTVTLGNMSESVREQMHSIDPALALHILSEPSARDTGAAVSFAANYIKKHFGGDAFLWILPSDHHIGDEKAMKESLDHALWAAEQDYLVTFGIQPTRPDTGYGYIRLGASLSGQGAFKADKFVEKPDLATAQQYLETKQYLWNSGMFVFSADCVLAQFEKHAKALNETVCAAMKKSACENEVDPALYASIEKRPFDKAIMEKADLVSVVPCNPDWSDIGSWESLWEIREKDEHGNVRNGEVFTLQSSNCLVQSKDKLIACAGVQDLVIIETTDSFLVADKSNSDIMKHLVNGMKAGGRKEVADFMRGSSGLEEIEIKGKGSVSLSGSGDAYSFVVLLEGKAAISDTHGKEKVLEQGEVFFLTPELSYRLENREGGALKAVKVGTSFALGLKREAAA
ncbi:MAG: mannose-1-phosphate guanylyltransferase [Alphaproteobacteria bacterium]|jgi:mannose-1-phosphate guanylyltransferase/mannose-6-phosphate isomerase|nr:mannose-1-phosphate guanylyltransferase [Alphaproteobacteria bacterium]QQS57094.1 MAG: mannose-1-phosphate guanylyltransferase [Alphaproteobacteria bacterium]